MKRILSIVLGLFVVSSVAFAKPVADSEFITMSKADSQFLFQEGAKVTTLDKSEMKETEGEGIVGAWWGAAIYTGWVLGDYERTGSWHGSWGGFGGAVGAGYMLFPW